MKQISTRETKFLRASILVGGTVSVLTGIATFTHLRFGNALSNLTGSLAVFDHFFDVCLALAVSLFLAGLGHRVCQSLKLAFASTAEQFCFCLFSGTGVFGLLLLGIGILGLFKPWIILLVIALVIVICRHNMIGVLHVLSQGLRFALSTPQTKLLTALFVSLLLFLALRATSPPLSADEVIYHLPATQRFVDQGRVGPNFDNALGNVPFLVHMIYVLFLMAKSDISAKLFGFFLAVAVALSLYAFCARYLSRSVGAVAMFLFFCAGMVVEVAVTARIDVSLAGMLFLCTYAMFNYLETKTVSWLLTSALFAGFSLGIKPSALIWLVSLGLLSLVEQIRTNQNRLRKVLANAAIYCCLSAAVASPWYLKNYVWFGNPVYPFVTGELAQFGQSGNRYFNEQDHQKLEQHFEEVRQSDPLLVASLDQELSSARDARPSRHPLRIWEYFTQPNKYLMAEPRHYPNYLFLLAPLLLFLPRQRIVLWLFVVSVVCVFATAYNSWIARYQLPAYPALTIVSAFVLSHISNQIRQRLALAPLISVYVIALALSFVIGSAAVAIRQFDLLAYLRGSISRSQFDSRLTYHKPIDFINRKLPADARVICIGAQMNYGIQRPYLTDESWFATKWRRMLVKNGNLDDLHKDLKSQGFTHVLYSRGLFTFAARQGLEGTGGMMLIDNKSDKDSQAQPSASFEHSLLVNWSTFSLYRKQYLEVVYQDNYQFEVLRLK